MPSSAGGYDFAARPSLSAAEQHVLWSPRVDTGVVMIDAAPGFLSLSPAQLPLLVDGRHSLEGTHAIPAIDVAMQLLLLPGGNSSAAVAAIIPLDGHTLGRMEALARFWRTWHDRSIPPDTRLTLRRRERLRLMIQAVDGRTNGASYREIGIVLFGSERIAETPWKTSSLRDVVIGLVEDGKALIAGGYLRLLRHRRAS